jgi:hypothetical protein
LIHRLLASLDVRGRSKLGLKFYDPFCVLEKIGDVAYMLQLPPEAKIHDIFHVGLLKKFKGEPPVELLALPHISHGRACAQLERVTCGRLAQGRREILVQWSGQPAVEATWTDLKEFQRLYPDFQLEDELLMGGEMSCLAFSTREGVTRNRVSKEARPIAPDGTTSPRRTRRVQLEVVKLLES